MLCAGLERGKASSVCSEGQEEYAQVVDHLRVVCEPSCVKKAIPEHSLIVLTPAHPVHYYALFRYMLTDDAHSSVTHTMVAKSIRRVCRFWVVASLPLPRKERAGVYTLLGAATANDVDVGGT